MLQAWVIPYPTWQAPASLQTCAGTPNAGNMNALAIHPFALAIGRPTSRPRPTSATQ
jgi:hypothetical protein